MMISALLIAVMLCTCAMAATYKANVFASQMEIYNVKKQSIATLPFGTEFTVHAISKDGNWAKVSFNGFKGFASMKNIMFQNVIKAVCTKVVSYVRIHCHIIGRSIKLVSKQFFNFFKNHKSSSK